MNKLDPETYNRIYEAIGDLKIYVRCLLDASRCRDCWDVQEAYAKGMLNIYRRWSEWNEYLLADDSLATQFFQVFQVLNYAHERSRRIHRARALDTALPQDQPVSDVVASIQRLTEALEDLPADHLPADLEPLQRDVANVKGLKELIGSAETAIELYLDARCSADYRDFLASKGDRMLDQAPQGL